MFGDHGTKRLGQRTSVRAHVEPLEARWMLSTNPGGPPNGPYGLVAIPVSPTTVQLAFRDWADNETSLVIEKGPSVNGPFTQVVSLPPSPGAGNLVQYTDVFDAPGQTYFYRAYALNGPYISSINGPVAVTTPNAPTRLTATVINTAANTFSVQLNFVDNSTSETQFEIDRANSPGGTFQSIGTVPAAAGSGSLLTFTDTNVVPNGFYSYRVRALLAGGGTLDSDPVPVTIPPPGQLQNPGGPPNGPFGLAPVFSTGSSITLSFTDNASNETGFNIDRATTPAGPFTGIASLGPSFGWGGSVTFTDTTVSPGTTYYYRAYAFSGFFNSSINGPVAATASGIVNQLPNPGGPPNGPYGFTATALSPAGSTRAIQFQFFDNATNETGFVIEAASSIAGPYSVFDTLAPSPGSGTLVSFIDSTNALPGKTYFFRVYAKNGTYVSSIAGPISLTTAA